MSREIPSSLTQGNEAPSQAEKKISEVRRVNVRVAELLRVCCTGGGLLHKAPENSSKRSPIMTTGVVIDPQSENLAEVMQAAPAVMLYHANADDLESYERILKTYRKLFVKGNGEHIEYGGPGFIALVDFKDVNQVDETLIRHQNGLFTASEDKNPEEQQILHEIAKHPVLLKVGVEQQLIDSNYNIHQKIVDATDSGRVSGFVFNNAKDLFYFRLQWENGDETSDKDVPFTVFCSDFKGLKDFFGKHSNECDAYMCTEELTDEQSAEIRDLRLANIQARVRNKIETVGLTPLGTKTLDKQSERNIVIGVLALQGAAKLEKWLLNQVIETYKPTFGIDVRYVYTREELEYLNPDALVLPGGWHGPMLEMIERMDMTHVIRNFLSQGYKAMVASCAGAIAARSDRKESTGCSDHVPLGIGNYAIINNAFNGILPYRVELNGGSKLSGEMEGVFVGAPEFCRLGEQVSRLAIVGGHDAIVGVKEELPNNSAFFGFSVHTPKGYLAALSRLSDIINSSKME